MPPAVDRRPTTNEPRLARPWESFKDPDGSFTLRLDAPALTRDQRDELAAHVMPDWQCAAACRSVTDDTWFPAHGQAALTSAAVARCAVCPVRRSCLAFALSECEDYGVWGGTTEVQRDALRIDLAAGVPIVDALDSATILPAYLWGHTA